MPTLSTLFVFAGAAFLLAIMPGPGLFYVAGRTLSGGRADGIASSLGTALGGMAHVLAGALGVSALVMTSATGFTILKIVGGAYLIYLGVVTWRSAEATGDALGAAPRMSPWRVFRQGFVMEATNPKTAAFFLALIPQFLDPDLGNVAEQFVVLGSLSIMLNTLAAFLTVAGADALRRAVSARLQIIRRVQRASGALLGTLSVSLLLTRRPGL